MSHSEIRRIQRKMNSLTNKSLLGFAPLVVDGTIGQLTKKRIKSCKYYLGYRGPHSTKIDRKFSLRLSHPRRFRYGPNAEVIRGIKRRVEQRRNWLRHLKNAKKFGVGTFDGRPCANVLIPILKWCRANGWRGTLVSGWRDPDYSEQLCIRMCGRPSCPGLCAGRASNHSGDSPSKFAGDVSDYLKFAVVVSHCPLKPRIFNALPRDKVHFSPSGR